MKLFDYSEITRGREAEAAKIPDEILDQPMNPSYPEGVEELAALLTFVPEEQRMAAVQGFIGAMLVT